VLCQGAASLLPDQDRPAVLLTVAVAPDGTPTLRHAVRAVVRSRAKLAYETADGGQLPPLLAELGRRIAAAEDARGASRIEFPEQEIVADPSAPGGLALSVRDRHACEDDNSAMSLAANLAVAQRMLAARVGLFRVMAEPDQREVAMLHHIAGALDVQWPRGASLRQLAGHLDAQNPKHAAFLLAARRAGGGASYAVYAEGTMPWHSAVAATYAHATAPLRRLADRYVLDLVVELDARGTPSADELATLTQLPDVMARAQTMGARVDHAAVDLVEAVELDGRVGEVFDAVVIDSPNSGTTVQLTDPPVRTRVHLNHAEPGDKVSLRLVTVDPAQRLVKFDPA
jgi:exoribonuclease R